MLVNNAGYAWFGPTPELDAATFGLLFTANVQAPYFLTAALAPKMAARGSGSIINIGSMAGEVGMPGGAAYGATKAALDSMTRSWAAEYSPAGVRINTVASGPVYTAIQSDEVTDAVGATTIMARAAQPDEIANVIVFLASPRPATSPARSSPPTAAGPPSERIRHPRGASHATAHLCRDTAPTRFIDADGEPVRLPPLRDASRRPAGLHPALHAATSITSTRPSPTRWRPAARSSCSTTPASAAAPAPPPDTVEGIAAGAASFISGLGLVNRRHPRSFHGRRGRPAGGARTIRTWSAASCSWAPDLAARTR